MSPPANRNEAAVSYDDASPVIGALLLPVSPSFEVPHSAVFLLCVLLF